MTSLKQFFSNISVQVSKPKAIAPSFLNILMTDVRPDSINQKLKSFYTIIDCCLKEGRKVNVVVVLSYKINKYAVAAYTQALDNYLKVDDFNLVFVKPRSRFFEVLCMFIFVLKFYVKLKGAFEQRFNFACLSTLARTRIDFFQKLFCLLPCDNWLGLTGGIELPAFYSKRKTLSKASTINALQFGQASIDQLHFYGYSADTLFVYDVYSKVTFQNLGMNIEDIVVSGSPEFEYDSSLINDKKLLDESRLSIVFVDQPVHQRGEYTEKYLNDCYAILEVLNSDPEIKVKIKKHPRGSAFRNKTLSDFEVTNDWTECLSKAHVVIGFFSNLCDFSLSSGRVTFFIGSKDIMGNEKCDWVNSKGGYIVSDVNFVLQKVSRLKLQVKYLTTSILDHEGYKSNLPSSVIHQKMVAFRET